MGDVMGGRSLSLDRDEFTPDESLAQIDSSPIQGGRHGQAHPDTTKGVLDVAPQVNNDQFATPGQFDRESQKMDAPLERKAITDPTVIQFDRNNGWRDT